MSTDLIDAADEAAFLAWLEDPQGGGYAFAVKVDEERWAGIHRLMFHWTLHEGLLGNTESYERRWCYADEVKAMAALVEWQSRGWMGEPEGWHRDPMTGRRRPDGDTSREYIAD